MKHVIPHRLLQDLRGISFDSEAKHSHWEILVDFLEIAAVASNKKPAHLQGQGMRSETLLRGIEEIAGRHGLRSLRTRPMAEFLFWPREPNYETEFFKWQREVDRRPRAQQPSVLWIFKDPALVSVITRTVSGDIDASAALGYPDCCVRCHDELGVEVSERLVEGYKREYGAKSVEDLIRLSKTNAKVRLDLVSPGQRIRQSAVKFPFVQFVACERCLVAKNSPAARANREAKKLARTLSRFFHDKIEKARRKEYSS